MEISLPIAPPPECAPPGVSLPLRLVDFLTHHTIRTFRTFFVVVVCRPCVNLNKISGEILKFRRPFHIRTPFSLYTLDNTNLILLYIMYRTTGLISKKVYRIKNIFGRFIGSSIVFSFSFKYCPIQRGCFPGIVWLEFESVHFFCKCLCFLLDKIPVYVCENQYRIRRGRRAASTSCRDSIHHEDNIVESTFQLPHTSCAHILIN